jgi:hypothetical protein
MSRISSCGQELLGSRGEHVEVGIIPEGVRVGWRNVFERAPPLAMKRAHAVGWDARLDHDLSQTHALFEQTKHVSGFLALGAAGAGGRLRERGAGPDVACEPCRVAAGSRERFDLVEGKG